MIAASPLQIRGAGMNRLAVVHPDLDQGVVMTDIKQTRSFCPYQGTVRDLEFLPWPAHLPWRPCGWPAWAVRRRHRSRGADCGLAALKPVPAVGALGQGIVVAPSEEAAAEAPL